MAWRDRLCRYPLDEAADVVVIGTGAGGGNMIRELCERGVKVVALEAGPRLDADRDFEEDEWSMFFKLSWLDPVIPEGPDITGTPTWICKTVGGTTTHWAGASLRIQPHEFRARTTYGAIHQANLEDWPIDYETMEPFYAEVERMMGVSGRALPPAAGNTNFLVLKKGADRLGLNAHLGYMAIKYRRIRRAGKLYPAWILFPGRCRNQAKWSSLYEAIPKAESTGLLDLRPNCQALEITVDKAGRASGVVYAREDGQLEEQKARVVVVAGNSIQTPRILLHSTSGRFPQGLGNGSGVVG